MDENIIQIPPFVLRSGGGRCDFSIPEIIPFVPQADSSKPGNRFLNDKEILMDFLGYSEEDAAARVTEIAKERKLSEMRQQILDQNPLLLQNPDEEKKQIRSHHFVVESEEFEDIMSHIQSASYKYAPKRITLVLKDIIIPGEPSPIFSWVGTHMRDNLTIIMLDEVGKPIYEHEFLGCRLEEHECPLNTKITKDSFVRHTVTLKYEHVNLNYYPKTDVV